MDSSDDDDDDSTTNTGKKSVHCEDGRFFPETINLYVDWISLSCAVLDGDQTKVKQLVEQGHNPYARGQNNWTLLHLASWSQDEKMVAFLVEEYPDLKLSCDEIGWTSLHHAVWGGNVEIFSYLVEQGLDPTCVTEDGNSVFHIAKQYNQIKMFRYLEHTYPELKKKYQVHITETSRSCSIL